MQTTLRSSVTFDGHGLHSGRSARMTLRPAPANHGIIFRRTDVAKAAAEIPARWDHVTVTRLQTQVTNAAGVSVCTIEHLMAALSGCGIHNVAIDIDGPEVPILDGSSAAFVRRIVEVGVITQNAPLRVIKVLRPAIARDGNAFAELRPATSLQIAFEIAFDDAAIGTQRKTLNMAKGAFVKELCDSRTFCRAVDVAAMRANGLALGGSLENAVVVNGARVLNPAGLRHADEAVRHKMLDALGDLYTAGAPILGRYTGHMAGHSLTNKLLVALFSDARNWRWMTCDQATAVRLPGIALSDADLAAVA